MNQVSNIHTCQKGKLRPHKLLFGASVTHLMIDGFSVLMYPILPLIAIDFNLSLAKIGILRTSYSFASSALQFPLALAFEGFNKIGILLFGLIWISAGFLAMGFIRSFSGLLILSIITGIGGNFQHPMGSAFISELYREKNRGRAIGILNFSGDFGKLIFPIFVTTTLIWFNWNWCFTILGAFGLLIFFILQLFFLSSNRTYKIKKSFQKEKLILQIENYGAYILLSVIGIIDGMTRSGLLTYSPFLFIEKGIDPEKVGFLLTIFLIGGAIGRLGCGFLLDRYGSVLIITITEFFTATLILALLKIPTIFLVPFLLICGFMVNGTSTVIYTTIASTIKPKGRGGGYGLFFTIYLIAEAIGPMIFGFIGDNLGLYAVFIFLSLISAIIIPIIISSKRYL